MTGSARQGGPSLTLALDAATYVGTVAVLADREVVAERDAVMRGEREERLMPAVDAALRAAGATARDLAAVVVGAGPGSFTSLRIAASIAKGIASGRSVPLFSVPSLWLVAAGARVELAPGDYLAVIDAMRGEWFGAPVKIGSDGRLVGGDRWALFTAPELDARAEHGTVVIGPGVWGNVAPHARGVRHLESLGREPLAPRVALDSWEPDYGRKAEAQVRWEAAHGRLLGAD